MAYVLKDVDKKFLRPHKTHPNLQNVTIPLPYGQFYSQDSEFGNIVVDKRNITEVSDTKVDVTLYFDKYDINFKSNDGEFKQETTSSEQIYQQYFFMKLSLKEIANTTNTPLYLRQISKGLINRLQEGARDYSLFTPLPKRLQHLAQHLSIKGIPYGYVNITDENDIIDNGTTNSYDICLSKQSYIVWFYVNDVQQYYQITRGELFEIYSKFQNDLKSEMQNQANNLIESETPSSTNSYEILRHINRKNITYRDDGTALVSINIPESLKEKASSWWCCIGVPESNIINEGNYRNNYFVTIRLYQTEYTVDIPTTPTSKYHKDIRTKWINAIVSRSELIEANERQIQRNMNFFRDFDRLVKP